MSRLRIDNPDICNDSKKKIVCKVNNKETCSVFWAAAYGASEDKMKGVRNMLRSGSTIKTHGSKGAKTKSKTSQYLRCYDFWYNFFDVHCQRPNDSLRLFPVNNSQRFIYDTYFMKWMEKQLPPPELEVDDPDYDLTYMKVPSFSYFKKAR